MAWVWHHGLSQAGDPTLCNSHCRSVVLSRGSVRLPRQEFHVYITEWEEFEFARDAATPLWSETLVYGRWDDGPSRDGSRGTTLEVDVPEVRALG